jgi:hypothetical protein
MDTGGDRSGNVYYALNQALRQRKAAVVPFRRWQGFLYFLMRALDQLPAYTGTVYRGGNTGLDQAVVRREYKLGRTVQWAAFSSTSTSLAAVKPFVERGKGVIFKLNVTSGRDISAYSYFPKENEILLSPNTRLVVTSNLYVDNEGYTRIDMAEQSTDTALLS